jgi:Leucine Rich repeat
MHVISRAQERSIFENARVSSRLTTVILAYSPNLFEKNINDIFTAYLGKLRHVDLTHCYQVVCDTVISLVVSSPDLLTLDLSYTCIGDNGLIALRYLQQLTDLSLEGCCSLTAPAMSLFLGHFLPPKITRLNLSHLFSVFGDTLASLDTALKFERLDVRYTEHITKQDVKGFKERYGDNVEVLTTAKLETDDERGWRKYLDEMVEL